MSLNLLRFLVPCSVYVLCCFNGCFGTLKTNTTLFVDCKNGIDNSTCGTSALLPCKTLYFTTATRAGAMNSSHLTISIAPGVCEEEDILLLDCNKNTTKSWAFITTNEKSKEATILQMSVLITKCAVTFSHLNWRTSTTSILFNTFTSSVTFQNCFLEFSSFQFTGFNTNLDILSTSVNNCSSADKTLPIFLLETVYNTEAQITIANSTFSNNLSPLFYARYLSQIFIMDSVFANNTVLSISKQSFLTVGASSVKFEHVIFSQNMGTVIEAESATNFTGTNLKFSSNLASNASCLLLHGQSNITLLQSSFENNINPVISAKEKDDMDINIKECHFACASGWVTPFVNAPDGIKINFKNCTKKVSCFVYCKSGELLKSKLMCQKCKMGSFSSSKNNITSSSCQRCPVGTYTSKTGSNHCTACDEGMYASDEGSTSCRKCTNDLFTSGEGAESCSEITLEFIFILVVTIPLIGIPLVILIGRYVRKTTNKKKDVPVNLRKVYNNIVSIND